MTSKTKPASHSLRVSNDSGRLPLVPSRHTPGRGCQGCEARGIVESADIVAAAARHLGVVPILRFATCSYSSRDSDELAKSQLYHCDSDEVEQVRIFSLCEDVGVSSGPLTFVPAVGSQIVRERLDYRYKFRLSEEQVHDVLGDDLEEVALTGPAGTAAFLDTSRCLHFGSRFTDTTFRHLAAVDHDDVLKMVLGTA